MNRHKNRAKAVENVPHIFPSAWPSKVLLLAVQCLFVLIPARAQQLPPVPVPPENPITEPKRILGKILFWEEQLSSDNSTACGSCHLPALGGSDPRTPINPGPDQVYGTDDDVIGSRGVRRSNADNQRVRDSVFGMRAQVTGRSAPSFFGMSAFAPELFWDGRATSRFENPETGGTSIASGGALESQAIAPILSDVEMAREGRGWADVRQKLEVVQPLALARQLPSDVAAALAAANSYPKLFEAAFGGPGITAERIAFAIATYERTLIPDQSPWDRFIAGDTGAMTNQQQGGWERLQENTVCLNCHVPPQFTDHLFHNIGLRPSGEDLGRQEVTGAGRDVGRFRTPSLRNSGLKPALMHVGWVTDIEDSIAFYNAGSGQVETGHIQFTEDQSGIPTSNPRVFADYDDIFMPEVTQGGQPFQSLVIDFIANALTDPRVANEQFPFDHPTLRGATGLCDDGLDNDGDGLTDFPLDPDCSAPEDNGEGSAPSSPPAAPSSLSATATSVSTIELLWVDNSGNEESFRIDRRLPGGTFSEIATVAANTASYSDIGLATMSTFEYRVVATNSVGDSEASNVASATTLEPYDCDANEQTVCLSGQRFQVEIEWRDFADGTGVGQVVLASEDSGLFWFFRAENWEMLVKVIDGCTFNDHFWVFASATTNVEYTLRVTDTETATTKEYTNPLGTAAPAITDTTAFATCP